MAETRLDDRLPSALTWTVDEAMERSSHALAEGGRVWLVDPVADSRALEAVEALVVPEAVGTASYFAVGGSPLGLHPFLRPRPPRGLAELAPRHVLPGHGPALHDDAAPALREALARGRRDIPRAALAGVKAFSPRRG